MISKKYLGTRGKQIDNKKEITPSYKNDPIAQEINRIYRSHPLFTPLTKTEQDRINDLRERMKARDYKLNQEYDATHPKTEQPLTEAEREAKTVYKFSTQLKRR